jgi:fibro-slime domain-containing protein
MKHRIHTALIPAALALACSWAVAPAQAASITLATTVRDFTPSTNSDFENATGGSDPGIVQATLGADGKPVYNAANSNPTVHSAASFSEWYNTTPSVNIAIASSITLNETFAGSGIYQYDNQNYFPIDNQGFGNYYNGHNYGFTTEIHTLFTYQQNQTFTFSGDDDVFVFINDQLVIDLGGIHTPETGTVDLNTLGLTAGNDYKLDIFQAERHITGSTFAMETAGLVLRSSEVPEPGSLALAGLGLLAAGATHLRRRSA